MTDAPPLPDWLAPALPYRRRMARIQGHDVHFIDHGEGPTVWLMHGNPTWCFLYRKVIDALGDGVRVIAPDLLGCGLSTKLPRPRDHQLDLHIGVMAELFDQLGLEDVVLVGQDWGGPIVAGVGMHHSARIHGIVFGNTGVLVPRRPLRAKAFHRFSHTPVVSDLVFRVGGFPQRAGLHRVQGDPSSIGAFEKRAYWWPLRRLRDRAAPLGLARMVPHREDHPSTATCDAIGRWVESWKGPAALVWGTRDPLLGRGLRRHRAALPQAEVTETQAGHFLQEEVPLEMAQAIRQVLPR